MKLSDKPQEVQNQIKEDAKSLPFPKANGVAVMNLMDDISKMIEDFQTESSEEDLNIAAGLRNLIEILEA